MKTEAQNSSKLPIKDLAKKQIIDGHLYLSTSSGRKFYLMKPGVLVDPAFIKKHATLNSIFDFTSVVNSEVKENFKSLLKELRYLQFEKDCRYKCIEILNYFYKVFTNDEHFLSFALACHEEFCSLTFADQLKMHETDIHLYRKSLYSSAFIVIIGISNEYFNYGILKDFYNLAFSLDIGLCESDYSYHVAQACNEENQKPGSGQIYLKRENATTQEIEVFLKHPQRSYEFIQQHLILSFSELIEAALYQHELADGTGFPRGIQKGQVSSWEAVIILADTLVEITDHYSFETSVIDYLINFQNKKLNDLPVARVYKKLCLAFSYVGAVKETGS